MTARRPDRWGLLATYPTTWRARYGDELLAMIEDQLRGREPGLRMRTGLAVAGLRERLRQAAGAGGPGSRSVADQIRGGYTLVLVAWAAFLVAGASYDKLAEHFTSAVPAPDGQALVMAAGAFAAVGVLAAAATAAVVVGALVAVPAFLRFLPGGGWTLIRRRVRWACYASLTAAVAATALAAVGNQLTAAQRNGGSLAYSMAFAGTAAIAVTALVLWTSAGVTVGRRLDLPARALSVEAMLAGLTTVLMAGMTAATAVWWGVLATAAPWFFWGAPYGTPSSPAEPNLIGTMALMLAATLVAAAGTTRALRGSRALSRVN
jgi:hypothetical protein